jgi:hypothetical protein
MSLSMGVSVSLRRRARGGECIQCHVMPKEIPLKKGTGGAPALSRASSSGALSRASSDLRSSAVHIEHMAFRFDKARGKAPDKDLIGGASAHGGF